MPLEPGAVVGHYRLVEKIGEGGMGVVWVAEDTKLHRRIALKVLPPEVSDDPDRRSRFEREARAVAALNHPNIVTVHSIEEESPSTRSARSGPSVRFITMEFVEGRTLDRELPDGGMPLERFFAIALPLADALARAHAREIVHRDIKSANIMVSEDGVPKILDFGLATMAREPSDPAEASHSPTMTGHITRDGAVLGTPAYMSPEQARGEPADARSDVFSLGSVFYEILSGKRPFQRGSGVASLAAMLSEPAEPLRDTHPDLPRDLDEILQRCLAKEPGERFSSAAELHAALLESRMRHGATAAAPPAGLSRPGLVVPALLVLVAAVVVVAWWAVVASREKKMRTETLPQIESLLEDGHDFDAFVLARDARLRLPGDPTVEKLFLRATIPVAVTTEPAGAEVRIQDYRDPDGEWIPIGASPIEARLPGSYLRFRVERDGYEPLIGAFTSWWGSLQFDLVPEGSAVPGMVRVPAGEVGLGGTEPVELPAHWIDRFEVTNREYQEFLDAGGYRNAEYWREPMEESGRTLSFEDAMARFVDQTGRPGPATWRLGTFPDGEESYPVRGVSWYEAAAYARWAGKSLPTVYHWRQAAGQGIFADILIFSNFDGDSPAPVGEYRGLGPFGTYDMAGNVTEWCLNRAGDLRYALGGSWAEPPYTFSDDNARSPFDRGPTLGFRCVRHDAPPPAATTAPIEATRFDFATIDVMSDELYGLVRERYDYPAADLDASVEVTDANSPHWVREAVSFTAAYEGERMLAHLFLPTGVEPPYQTVIFRPGASVNWLTRVEDFLSSLPAYLPRSGRAVVVPAMWGTLERRGEGRRGGDRLIRQAQDVRRTLDYLETRPEFDLEKLAYLGLSAGAEYGPVYVAVEDRFDAAIFIAGGFHDEHMLREPRDQVPWNFASRVLVPTLMVNGDNDFTLPLELAQEPMFELLGTDPEHKRHVVLEGGHVPFDTNAAIRETLDWLDRYLGPVEKN